MDLPNNLVCLEQYRRNRLTAVAARRRSGGSRKAAPFYGEQAFDADDSYQDLLHHLSKEQERRRHLTLGAIGVVILVASLLIYVFCRSFTLSMAALI